jgi:hypothetical protein
VVAVAVVVGVVEVAGAFSPPPQAEVIAPIAMMAATPANAGRRRAKGRDFMTKSYLYCATSDSLMSRWPLWSDNHAWK